MKGPCAVNESCLGEKKSIGSMIDVAIKIRYARKSLSQLRVAGSRKIALPVSLHDIL